MSKIDYLQDKFDPQEVLESLGIKIAHVDRDNIMAHCPNSYNHKNGDRNPSFGYSIHKMVSHCFVCGGRSLLNLIQDQLNISYKEAEEWLVKHSNLDTSNRNLKEEVLKRAAKGVVDTLPVYKAEVLEKYDYSDGNKAIQYLRTRGVYDDVAKDMGIGYVPEHDGIIFPHFFKFNLVGWQIRHLGECEQCVSPPKYKSTRDMPKKNTLYNYDKALEHDEPVIVVESPMSVLRLKSAGYQCCVATFGSWSKEQVNLLAPFGEIIAWPDADSAGRKNFFGVLEDMAKLATTKVVPLVDKQMGGDAGDLTDEEIKEYLKLKYSPIYRDLIKGSDLFGVQKVRG